MAENFDVETLVGNPAGYMAQAIDQGWSATQALVTYRADGGRFGNDAWFQQYGQVAASLANAPAAAGLDPYLIPDANQYSTWALGRGGEYATQVQVQVVDTDTGVSGTINYTYKTSEPHTPIEAMQAAIAAYGDDETLGKYAQTIQGSFASNVYMTVPYSNK